MIFLSSRHKTLKRCDTPSIHKPKNQFMKLLKRFPLFFVLFLFFSCDEFQLTDNEIAAGLKSALEVGSKYALNSLGKDDGFLLDQAVKIGLPPDVATIVKQISKVPGFNLVIKGIEEQLILTINRAAEASIEEVIPIVLDAITSMSIQDAKSILFADNDRAATNYLLNKTYESLCDVCGSVIGGALNKPLVSDVSAQKVWGEFTNVYNSVVNLIGNNPLYTLDHLDTDLTLYTTQKTLDGVFLKVGDEEVKIRTNVSARVNDLLRKVFGQLD